MTTADPQAIVRQAMQLFWNKGTAVAFSEIVAATGQNRKALYALFGDKATLIGAALGLYRKEVLTPMIDLLKMHDGPRVYWKAYEEMTRLPGWNGCMLIRAATAENADLDLVQDAFRAYSDQFVKAMKAAYIRQGEVGDPEKCAWAAFSVMVSVSSLAGSSGLDDRVEALLDVGRSANGLLPVPEIEMPEETLAS